MNQLLSNQVNFPPLCIQRYLSAFCDCYVDIKANVLGDTGGTQKNILAFCLFSTVQSNGSLFVAEVVRNMAMNNWSISQRFSMQYKSSLWSMMIDIAKNVKLTTVGSCTKPRFQISIGNNLLNFEKCFGGILHQFSKFKTSDSQKVSYDKFLCLLDYLKKNVKYIGHVTALKFIQLSALLGLLPLNVATFAAVDSGGPGKLIRLCKDTNDPNGVFLKLHKEFESIWGPRFTMAYFENLLCELYRELSETVRKKKVFGDVDILHNKSGGFSKIRSSLEDHIVLHAHRGMKQCISNLFRIDINGSGNATLDMQVFKFDERERKVTAIHKVKADSIGKIAVESYYHGYEVV